MSSNDVLIEVRGLCVDYGLGGGAVHAVVDADLDLRRGEVLGLAGESGSGKSTLAYAITRLLRPPGVITAGSARFAASVNTASGNTASVNTGSVNTVGQHCVGQHCVGQPAHRRPARAAGAALERDRRGAAELDERAEPGAVDRHPVLRRAEGAPAGHEPRRPAGPVGRAARDGGYPRRPAGQLPARALRRDAAAGDDRHRARARPVGGDPGRTDDRTGRGDSARDPRGAHGTARPAGLRRAVYLPRPVAAGRDRRFDRGHVRGPAGGTGRRQRDLPRAAAPVLARPAELVPGLARAAPGHGRHPRVTPRPAEHAGRVLLPPALRVRVRPVPQ